MRDPPRILVVDDDADSTEILRARLASHGYEVETAADGLSALTHIAATPPDLVLLDVMMPGIDGVETVRRLKADPRLPFIPVVLLTSRADHHDVVAGLDAGADDYLTKPIEHSALVARVRAVLRVKALQDEIVRQAAELSSWNRRLEERVSEQLAQIDRMRRLKRFLAPQVVEAILTSADGEGVLESHRRDVAVLFCDLRGFTAFSESGEPEDVLTLLRDYHALVGDRVFHYNATIERFAGDAIMVLFNDPVPRPDYCLAAARLGLDIARMARPLTDVWRARGFSLGVGIGISSGIATLGEIGFGERVDYAAIGSVTNLAARLSTRAEGGQVLVSRSVAESVAIELPTRALGDLALKGFKRPVPVFELPLGDVEHF